MTLTKATTQTSRAARSEHSTQIVDVLDGFFEIRARSSTLHGDAPVRAVQACPPFAQGSGYGWELRYSGIGLALQAQGEPAVHMIDELTPGFDYTGQVRGAAEQGYIAALWLEQLLDNWWWRDPQDNQRIHLWTGLVAKPSDACHLRLTELFNSPHLQLDLQEQWINGAEGWTPLILSFDLRNTERSAIAGTVASLSPLPRASAMETVALADYPWIGQRVLDYYSPSYYQQKLSAPPTRAYAKLLRAPTEQPDWLNAQAQTQAIAVAADPADAGAIRFGRWTQKNGQASIASESLGPTYAELLAPADIRLLYLGRSFEVSMGDGWDDTYQRCHQVWEQLYGATGARYLDDATFDGSSCVHPTSGHPVMVLNIEPLLRFATKPGWSLLFEGASETFAWGLRGVISSANFHSGALAFQCFDTPKTQVIEQGSLLGRIIPIPDDLLTATFELKTLAL